MHIDPHCINPPESATPIELDDVARALRKLLLVARGLVDSSGCHVEAIFLRDWAADSFVCQAV